MIYHSIDAKGKPFATTMALELIWVVQSCIFRRYGGYVKFETEWLTSPVQNVMITDAQFGADMPIPESAQQLMRSTEKLCGRNRVVDWKMRDDLIVLRDAKTQEDLGYIEHLQIPKI